MASSWKHWLFPSVKWREERDTRALWKEARTLSASSPFGGEGGERFILDMVVDICAEHGQVPSVPLGNALWDAILGFLATEGLAIELGKDEPPQLLTIEEGSELRAVLRRHLAFLRDHKRLLPVVRRKLVVLFSGILRYLPPSAFTDISEGGETMDDSIVLPKVKARDLCEALPEVLDRTIVTLFDEDIRSAHLFDVIRGTLERNSYNASGIPPEKRAETSAKIVLPSDHKDQDPQFLVDRYLGGTPLHEFFDAGLPFAIPFPARFEHTHIVGGTGHGKTQLIQFLINHDLVRGEEDGRSVVIIDSQGDLIRTISGLGYFSLDRENGLAERYVSIDPTDVEHPVALNMFDFNRSRLSGYAPLDREKILNATVELYDYFFGALLGAELTQRQGLIFRYLARLLIEIPGATIHTLRELMEDGERFLPYMEKLTGTARAFFATRFFDRSFNETKKQILARLWGVLANTALERMFSHKESKVDLFEMLNSGKVVFIHTAKDLLGEDGARIFGRFFVALIAQAAIQRATIPPHERRSAFVYIDEAQDYFDQNIANLLTQARKYRVGLIFAHQSLDQLVPELRGSVLANTTIKFAGGVSAKDAPYVAAELRCDADFLLSQKRRGDHTEFACYVRNFTGKALSVRIPLGYVESLPRLTASEDAVLRDANRKRYCAPPEAGVEAEFSVRKDEPARERALVRKASTADMEAPAIVRSAVPDVEPVSEGFAFEPTKPTARPRLRTEPRELPKAGRGGREHKYFQHLIKQLAEERGFRATIEEQILDGKGEVDVSLSRGDRRIACEISVTTTRDHELGNVEKCIAAGYKDIVLVGTTERHVKALSKFIEENLDEGHGATIRYASPETLVEYLDQLGEPPPPSEATVRGYKVKTKRQVRSPEEVAERRAVLAGVIAKSLARTQRQSE